MRYGLTGWSLIILLPAVLLGAAPAPAATPADLDRTTYAIQKVLEGIPITVSGPVTEVPDVTQEEAERLFSLAEAAIYLPDLRRVRMLGNGQPGQLPDRALPLAPSQDVRQFLVGLGRDFPVFAEGAYLLKAPRSKAVSAASASPGSPGPADATRDPLAQTTVFSDGFGSLGAWSVTDNTGGAYRWGVTSCIAHAGSYAASAISGGYAYSGSCSQSYPNNYETSMQRTGCDSVQGATTAGLTAYIQVNSEAQYDGLGFYFLNSAGTTWYGYGYTGAFTAWYLVSQNLRSWYGLGDLTQRSCVQLMVDFSSDSTNAYSIGARVDDVTISADWASSCTYSLNPTSVSLPQVGGSTVVSVTAGTGCAWVPSSNASWIQASGSGSGNGSFLVQASANTGTARTGTVTVADQTLTVSQAGTPGVCTPNATTLCINNRFQVQVSWYTSQGGGQSGQGNAVSTSSLGFTSGGIFWFFSSSNPEMLVKVVNGCSSNGRYWVFASAGTNVGLNLSVTDTTYGQAKTYTNPDLQAAQPIQDTNAFATCP